jgi:hypothetical protein
MMVVHRPENEKRPFSRKQLSCHIVIPCFHRLWCPVVRGWKLTGRSNKDQRIDPVEVLSSMHNRSHRVVQIPCPLDQHLTHKRRQLNEFRNTS